MGFGGTWKIEIPTPIGTQLVELVIIDTPSGLSGTATSAAETAPFIDPEVEGDRITWVQHVTRPMRLTIRFELKRTGDSLEGTAKAGLFPAAKVSGRRIA